MGRLLAALLASPPFTMRLDMTDGQVVEVIATWAVLVFSRFLYIFCPLVFGLPDHLQHSLQLPGWGPLGCLWRRLPRVQQSLQRSARWPLVTNWVLLAVAGGAFLAASDGRPTTHRLFGWKNVTVICNAVAEIFQVLYPASQGLTSLLPSSSFRSERSWRIALLPVSLGLHAIWLGISIWQSQLELLDALTMVTHFSVMVCTANITLQLDSQNKHGRRIRWWMRTALCVWVVSCAGLVATMVSSWRTGHLALQCACVEVLFWERAIWKWTGTASNDLGENSASQEAGNQSDGSHLGGSVRSTAGLLSRTSSMSCPGGIEDILFAPGPFHLARADTAGRECIDAETEYLVEFAKGDHLAVVTTTGPCEVLEVSVGTGKWATEFATLHRDSTVASMAAGQQQGLDNLVFYNYDASKPWTDVGRGEFDYIRFAFLDGSIPSWDAIVGQASQTLKPGGVLHIADISFPLDSGAWNEALFRMKANTDFALGAYQDCRCQLALQKAGFEIDDQSQTQTLSHGDKRYNDRDLLEAVAERVKGVYVRALEVGPFRQEVRKGLAAMLVADVLRGLRIKIISITARKPTQL